MDVIKKYEEYRKKLLAYDFAMNIIAWDSETEAPIECFDERSNHIGVLSEESYKIKTCDEYINIVNELFSKKDELDKSLAFEIANIKKEIDKTKKIPMDEYIEYSVLLGKSQNAWKEAKQKNDYSLFAPYLEKIINYNKKYIKYLETDELKGYDVLLDIYEPGFRRVEYDAFFNLLKEKLVPFISVITNDKKIYPFFLEKNYDINKQKEFVNYLLDVLCFNKKRGLIKESEHPFTNGFGIFDVRITNHYYENMPTSSIFSAIHELGHAIYEQQVDEKLSGTYQTGGATMAMHESQSRFYENIIGRSKAFWEVHFGKLKELFKEELKNVSLEDFYKAINKCECSLIRTEADELTYPIHIMIRYDIEQEIFENKINVNEIPARWNELVKKYLGIDVPNDTLGVLQDIHWSIGSFGYFPTYALGTAISAQILNAMMKDFNVFMSLKDGNTKRINEWLKDKIHRFGNTLHTKELLLSATGEEFNPEYYINYLVEKFTYLRGL